jgi:hypothetical protein
MKFGLRVQAGRHKLLAPASAEILVSEVQPVNSIPMAITMRVRAALPGDVTFAPTIHRY